eukprot:5142053-Prymnesium_polylepis.1
MGGGAPHCRSSPMASLSSHPSSGRFFRFRGWTSRRISGSSSRFDWRIAIYAGTGTAGGHTPHMHSVKAERHTGAARRH